MNRKEVEDILESMKTSENREAIEKIFESIKLMDDASLQNAIKQAGGTREAVTQFLEKKINEIKAQEHTQEHIPINEMFSYGTAGNCVHLHLPMDLHSLFSERGLSKTMDTVNLYLLDAIDKMKEMRDSGNLQGIDSIYMISPILRVRELKFLREMDFETATYKKGDLASEEFLQDNPEAVLATRIFGREKNVGTARISFHTIDSISWQEKKVETMRAFADKGITFLSESNEKSESINFENLDKIGEGKCAKVYRKDDIVYKILKQNSDSIRLYSKEMLQQLVGINSELCTFPNEILVDDNGNLLGYSMNLVQGKNLNEVLKNIPFDQIQMAMEKAKQGVNEVSEQGIIFDDLHSDNLMWDEQTQSFKIIDTDFFKKTNDTSLDLSNTNFQKLSNTIQKMIASRISDYGITENEEFIPFYGMDSFRRDESGKKLSLSEYISNLRTSMERDFGRKFETLGEMEEALQERQDEVQEEQYLQQVANNLTPKEKIIRFLAQNNFARRLPFVNKFIDNQIKMLPESVQTVINSSANLAKEEADEMAVRKDEFEQRLTSWKTNPSQTSTIGRVQESEKKDKKREDDDAR